MARRRSRLDRLARSLADRENPTDEQYRQALRRTLLEVEAHLADVTGKPRPTAAAAYMADDELRAADSAVVHARAEAQGRPLTPERVAQMRTELEAVLDALSTD